MILIVGLGNPGKDYEKTPHNMGFRILDFFHDRYIPDIPWQKALKSAVVKGELEGVQLILQKPFAFMNNSGVPVVNLMRAYQINDGNSFWVIHDELDLPWGRVKVVFGRNSAGHKGVASIIDALGHNQFWRFRVGIRPEIFPEFKADVDRYLTNEDIPFARIPWDAMLQEKVSELIAESLNEGIRKRDFIYTAMDIR